MPQGKEKEGKKQVWVKMMGSVVEMNFRFPVTLSRYLAFELRSKALTGLLWPISFFFFLLFRTTPTAHGSSQARDQIGAIAAGLSHSHSKVGSELHP